MPGCTALFVLLLSATIPTPVRRADIDLLLLTDEEFNQFQNGQPQSVTYELNSAHNQMVDWWVPATRAEAKTYHLVFINSADDVKLKFVQADFTLTFE